MTKHVTLLLAVSLSACGAPFSLAEAVPDARDSDGGDAVSSVTHAALPDGWLPESGADLECDGGACEADRPVTADAGADVGVYLPPDGGLQESGTDALPDGGSSESGATSADGTITCSCEVVDTGPTVFACGPPVFGLEEYVWQRCQDGVTCAQAPSACLGLDLQGP